MQAIPSQMLQRSIGLLNVFSHFHYAETADFRHSIGARNVGRQRSGKHHSKTRQVLTLQILQTFLQVVKGEIVVLVASANSLLIAEYHTRCFSAFCFEQEMTNGGFNRGRGIGSAFHHGSAERYVFGVYADVDSLSLAGE
uniref:Biotin synthesis protein BioH n=1 Tax=Cucumis sativus TaxID=3659 RepID=A0A0A0KS96_CUCSA